MKRVVLAIALVCGLISCGKSVEKEAARYLESARQDLENNQFASAKLRIDSLKTNCPKAFEARKAAIRLMQDIETAEQLRTLGYQDSVMTVLTEQFEAIRSRYAYEKDEQYMDLGLFTISSQSLENNLGRNFLRAQVDEKGKMSLISNFSAGSYIHHKSIRVTAGETYLDSPVSDDVYEFKDLGICYEKCNFTAGLDGGVSQFIAINSASAIKVTLNGERSVEYTMTAQDRKAIAQLYELSLILTSINDCNEAREEAERKLEFIQNNRQKSETKSAQ